MNVFVRRTLYWLVSMSLLGCSQPVPLDLKRLQPIRFGTPLVQGTTLTIPVHINDGHGFSEPNGYLCKVQSNRSRRTIALTLYRCTVWYGYNEKTVPHITQPSISVPYDGPGSYQVVLLNKDNQSTDLGTIEVIEKDPTHQQPPI